ncbi:hypothetical protein PMAC_000216 [Pneumocystis sp. 'macacae']|nr:hypothetical protein PMAC_000216 [Pneumocystis sp. 'macacae']
MRCALRAVSVHNCTRRAYSGVCVLQCIRVYARCVRSAERVLTTQSLGRCRDLIRAVAPRQGATQTEARIAANVRAALADKVQAENMLFRKKQTEFLAQQAAQYRGVGGQQLIEAEAAWREKDIARIEEKIVELSEIFQEIQTMVADQGWVEHRGGLGTHTSGRQGAAEGEAQGE